MSPAELGGLPALQSRAGVMLKNLTSKGLEHQHDIWVVCLMEHGGS